MLTKLIYINCYVMVLHLLALLPRIAWCCSAVWAICIFLRSAKLTLASSIHPSPSFFYDHILHLFFFISPGQVNVPLPPQPPATELLGVWGKEWFYSHPAHWVSSLRRGCWSLVPDPEVIQRSSRHGWGIALPSFFHLWGLVGKVTCRE